MGEHMTPFWVSLFSISSTHAPYLSSLFHPPRATHPPLIHRLYPPVSSRPGKADSRVGHTDLPPTHPPPSDTHTGYIPLSPRALAAQTAGLDTDGSAYLKKLLANHLGPQYILLRSIRRVQMRLRVYVRIEWKEEIKEVTHSGENTGLLHVYGNKGGLAVAFCWRGTTLCFVSCHLAAHEGR